MNGRERVLAMIDGGKPDRIPCDGSFSDEIIRSLGRRDVDEVNELFTIDLRHFEPECLLYADGRWERDELRDYWGVTQKRVKTPFDWEFTVVENPLAEALAVADLESYPWPSMDLFDFAGLKAKCRRYEPYALACGSVSVMYTCFPLRGMERFLMDLYKKPEFARSLIRRVNEFNLSYLECIFKSVGRRIDFIKIYEDLGTQRSLIVSPKIIRDFFFQPWKRIIDFAHAHRARVMFHSCGAVFEAIPLLLELGIDMLDPVQTTAVGMEPEKLAEHYAGQVCFHGGVDTQRTLPYGTPEEVRQLVKRLVQVMTGRRGKYILCPSQVIQGDVQAENVRALYDMSLRSV